MDKPTKAEEVIKQLPDNREVPLDFRNEKLRLKIIPTKNPDMDYKKELEEIKNRILKEYPLNDEMEVEDWTANANVRTGADYALRLVTTALEECQSEITALKEAVANREEEIKRICKGLEINTVYGMTFEQLLALRASHDRLVEAMKGITNECDNQNPTHENIWRIGHEALEASKAIN